MRLYKKTMVKIFFVIEIIVFIGVYLYGGNGLEHLNRLEYENQKLEYEVVELKNELAALQKDLKDWNTDFKKEQFARENLQLAKKGDKIYFLK